LHLAIQSYEKLIRSVRLELSDSTRAAVDLTLSYIRCQLPAAILRSSASSNVHAVGAILDHSLQNRTTNQSAGKQRYLGEASDLRFFHTIKNILQDQDQTDGVTENDIQSYDQGIPHLEMQGGINHPELPTKELADSYIDIYFFTIHIAYPFLSKPLFIECYEGFWKGDIEARESSSWLSLMCEFIIILRSCSYSI
jgi:hypothetical protein